MPPSSLDGLVRIEGRNYTFRDLYSTGAGKRLLIRMRGKPQGAIACLCRRREPLALQVYSTPEGPRLRCYPDTGPLHRQDCLRNGISHVGEGSRCYSGKAITRDGRYWDVHLRDQLIAKPGAAHSPSPPPAKGRDDQRETDVQGRATLLTALRAIWQITGLNGTVRKFGNGEPGLLAASRLAKQREFLRFNGEPARQVCILPGIDRMATHPRLSESGRDATTWYAIVIGAITRVVRDGSDALVTLRHGDVPLRAEWNIWQEIVAHSPFPRTDALIQALSQESTVKTLVVTLIARVARDEIGQLRLVNGALMVVASFWPVPVDSRAELQVLWHLSSGTGRRFVKPLLYRAGDLALPDFVVLDCALPTVIEVYGRTGSADYDRRRDVKRDLYAANRDRVGYVELFSRKGAMLRLPDRVPGAFDRHKHLVEGLEVKLGLQALRETP
ncbi:hypothetical protein DCD74_07125 [Lysobacter oculi]|uniref:DUF1173 domain-containing protein n=1 Tax=Solilutibacter oculi TaxID=2698682 RepID=A0A344J626_9GAMM|nr:DUF1173 family protein [Lysobacter oculi]AXA84486.1 hypothetical protein DCD74_07125 [Lysobacter oculi]